METIQASVPLIKDTLVLHLNSQSTSAIVLNGDYKSNLLFDLRSYLDLENDDSIEYATCSMPYAVITNSNYIVNEYNNILSLLVDDNLYSFIIPSGNYTKTSWIAYWQTTLNATLGVGTYINITADSVTNKFTLTPTALFISTFGSVEYGFTNYAFPQTSDYIWGFSNSIIASPGAPSLTMPRCFNFLPVPRFLFHANILANGIMLTNNSSVGSSDVIAAIPNVAKLNSQIIYENNSSNFQVKTQINMSGLNIKITDDNNNLINFNGISCYFDIKFDIYRRSIKKPQNFTNLLKTIKETVTNQNENVIVEE